ncbi:MAG: nicotinate phosphoribosyltransferase, partial [Chlorobi bacterium]|nr:nicotinate phosphoribosyltransferase [Chlorobiota bacterium]
ILRVEGPLAQLQIIESVVLNILNYSSLIATKAARMRLVAGPEAVLADFGMRRAHGLASLFAAYASYIGGFNATSNVLAGKMYGIPIIGTMAHSWIQSFDSEEEAFEKFAEIYREKTVFLVDTYDTLNSGIPNAIKVAKRLEEKGIKARGIRLDSGDFIELSRKARQMLDEAGLTYMKIIVSNNVDEYLIESLRKANAPVDGYGVGTRLVTAYDQPALDGVYKLVEINGKPRIKISNDSEKVVLPLAKSVYRARSKATGKFAYDIVVPVDESELPKEAVPFYHSDLKSVKIDRTQYEYKKMFIVAMEGGNRIYQEPTEVKRQRAQEQIERLPDELKKLKTQTYYKVFFDPEIVSEFEKLKQLS